MSRRLALIAVAAVAAVATVIAVATVHTGGGTASLERLPGSEDQCAVGTQAAFAIDYLRLRSRTATATVTRVELQGVKGDLRLVHVALVPFTTGGTGFKWGAPTYARAPAWRYHQELPAQLHYVPDLPGVPPSGGRTQWQLLVDAHTGTGGQAQHVLVTYSDGGHTRRVTGKDLVAVEPTSKQCEAVLGN